MIDRKQFKTKICFLYQKGRCSRQNCTFAHGNVELRRSSASYSVRQEYRGDDLRDKLDRRQSPRHRFSSRGDAKKQLRTHVSGYSPTESPDKRKRRRTYHFDGHSDFSGSRRNSQGTKGHIREGKVERSDPKNSLEEQLRHLNSDIKMLEEHRLQLGVYLEEKVQEADSLTSRIKELDSQLEREKEQCKRITSKIKKFVKAHNRCSRLESDLKRSQARLHKLGDHLGSDAARNDEDSNINIVSEGETNRNAISPQKELNNDASPRNQDFHVSLGTHVHPNENANLLLEEYPLRGTASETGRSQPNDDEEVRAVNKETSSPRASAKGGKQSSGKSLAIDNCFGEKVQLEVLEARIPTNRMAANAFDIVEIVAEDTMDVVETPTGTGKIAGLPFLLPAPLPGPRDNYSQYEGNDENVNVDGHEEEMADVDII